ncbi:MAG TPA: hypothetical protein VH301_15640, partial [Usitatibacter sp.]|nr:hypothetical protein [Usitatibacter sp.]
YLLRVPVRYYHHPPSWFHGWAGAGAPHWHEHWGASWADRRSDWVHWDNHAHMPSRAPLPSYQSRYAGTHYPRVEEQARFHNQNYHYTPREQMVQQHYNEHGYQHAQRVEQHVEKKEEKREEKHEKHEDHHEHR